MEQRDFIGAAPIPTAVSFKRGLVAERAGAGEEFLRQGQTPSQAFFIFCPILQDKPTSCLLTSYHRECMHRPGKMKTRTARLLPDAVESRLWLR